MYKYHTVYQLSPCAIFIFFAIPVNLLTQFTQKKPLNFNLI